MTLIGTRDDNTRRFLQEYTDRSIEVVGDPAMYIAVAPMVRCRHRERARLSVGVTLPFHGPASNQWVRKYLVDFIGALKILARDLECRFFYFVHYDSELLVAKLIMDAGVDITTIYVGAEQLASAYQKVDIQIGGMLHSCILATAAGTPSIGLAYDHKYDGFFELIHSSRYCIQATPFDRDKFLDTVMSLVANLQFQRATIALRRGELSERFRQVVLSLADLA